MDLKDKAFDESEYEEDDEEDEEADIGTPIASLLFDFLTDPRSSIYARIWSGLTIVLVLSRILELSLESCSGPNQYDGRQKDLSEFHFLLTKQQYWNVYIALMVPLIIDGLARLLFLLLILWESESHPIYEKFRGDLMEVMLFCTDVIGLIPFFAQAAYYQPNNATPTNAGEVVLSLLELLLTGRIFRVVRKYPAIQAITRALSRSVEHLILPLFFFFVFNITAGVFFYFSQPCYNVTTCAWHNLFDATFYSIVSMTTTGYGNQIPYFELARFVACAVMVFGALFLSMPLAIIGNEYDRAWNEIKEENRLQGEKKDTGRRKSALLAPDTAVDAANANNNKKDTSAAPNSKPGAAVELVTMDDKRLAVRLQPVMTILDQIHRILSRLHEDYLQHRHHIPHSTVIALCELKAWIPTFCLNLEQTITLMLTISSQEFLANMTEMVVENFAQQGQPAQSSATATTTAAVTHTPFGGGAPFGGGRSNAAANNAASANTGNNDILQRIQEMKKAAPAYAYDDMGGSYHGSNDEFEEEDEEDEEDSNYSWNDMEWSDMDSDGGGSGNGDGGGGGGGGGAWKPSQIVATNNERRKSSNTSIEGAVLSPSQIMNQQQQRKTSRQSNGSNPAIEPPDAEQKRDGETGGAVVRKTSLTGSVVGSGKLSKVAPVDDSMLMVKDSAVMAAVPVEADTGTSSLQQTGAAPIRPIARRRTSVYVKLLEVIGIEDRAARQRTVTEDFVDKMERVSRDPNSWRSRIWILLEMPSSSREARALQILLIVLISISIFALYTQTVTKLTRYGESTFICQELVEVYCGDKTSAVLDPACYAHYPNGTLSSHRLRYYCEDTDCFGHGANFGATNSSLTCANPHMLPFQTQDMLYSRYGTPNLLFSRLKMHRAHNVCTRTECMNNDAEYFNASGWWIGIEFFINIVFSIEICLRVLVADSFVAYWKDRMNAMDILAVLPFYFECFNAVNKGGGFAQIDFSILASSPEDMMMVYIRALKVLRLIKLTRHFRASKVLLETARRVVFQIFGMLTFLAFLVLLFAIILYQLEKGRGCYAGDPGCVIPEDVAYTVKPGEYVWLNKAGDLSSFPNVFYGVWFSFVTITTVGYGDIVPITQGGMAMAIFLMIAGQFYMAMPLTAAATTFYQVHIQYEEDSQHVSKARAMLENKEGSADGAGVAVAVAANGVESNNGKPAGLAISKEPVLEPQMIHRMKHFVKHLRSEESALNRIVEDIQAAPFAMFDVDTLEQERIELKAQLRQQQQQQQQQGQLVSDSMMLVKQHVGRSAMGGHDTTDSGGNAAMTNLMRAAQLRHRVVKLCKELEEQLHTHEDHVVDVLVKYQNLLTGKLFENTAK